MYGLHVKGLAPDLKDTMTHAMRWSHTHEHRHSDPWASRAGLSSTNIRQHVEQTASNKWQGYDGQTGKKTIIWKWTR